MNALRLLLFFPSITFNVVAAEVFPWATLYGLIAVRIVPLVLVVFVAALLGSALWAWADFGRLVHLEMIRSIMAYLNPWMAFIALMYAPQAEVRRVARVARWALWAMVVVGVLQVTGLALLFEDVLQLLIRRASGSLFGGGRGATLLATEPSRAAVEFLFVYAAVRLITPMRPAIAFIADCMVALFLLVAVRSVLGVAFLGILALVHYPVLSLAGAAGLLVLAATVVDNRLFALIAALSDANALDDAFFFLLDESGFRGVSVLSAYAQSVENPLGSGVGNWRSSSVEAMRAFGLSANDLQYFQMVADGKFVGVRPAAYAANVALDLGISGVLLLTVAFAGFLIRGLRRNKDVIGIVLMWCFYVYALGDVGDPVPWVCAALALRMTDDSAQPVDSAKVVASGPAPLVSPSMVPA